MGPGEPGVPGAPAQDPALEELKNLRRHEAAPVLHQHLHASLLGSPAQEQPMSIGVALACHPAQVCMNEATGMQLVELWISGEDTVLFDVREFLYHVIRSPLFEENLFQVSGGATAGI